MSGLVIQDSELYTSRLPSKLDVTTQLINKKTTKSILHLKLPPLFHMYGPSLILPSQAIRL